MDVICGLSLSISVIPESKTRVATVYARSADPNVGDYSQNSIFERYEGRGSRPEAYACISNLAASASNCSITVKIRWCTIFGKTIGPNGTSDKMAANLGPS